MQPYKLLLEKPVFDEIEVVVEETNTKADKNYFLSGPYLLHTKPNKNNRIYPMDEMEREVKVFTESYITQNRAGGELNHPTDRADLDLERCCHKILSLEKRGDFYIGKSLILSTPTGNVLKALLKDNFRVGLSSRSLGQLVPEGQYSKVKNLKIIAIDVVADPSSNELVTAIMEKKDYLIDQNGVIVELACDSLECRLNKLPKKDVNNYLKESFQMFFAELKKGEKNEKRS